VDSNVLKLILEGVQSTLRSYGFLRSVLPDNIKLTPINSDNTSMFPAISVLHGGSTNTDLTNKNSIQEIKINVTTYTSFDTAQEDEKMLNAVSGLYGITEHCKYRLTDNLLGLFDMDDFQVMDAFCTEESSDEPYSNNIQMKTIVMTYTVYIRR